MSSIQVFLTRPAGRNGTVSLRLKALGLHVHELPALELRALTPARAVPLPQAYDLVVFVSRYAAQRYLQLLAEAPSAPSRWPAATLAATVGASSARALFGFVPPECIVHPPADTAAQDSESLLAILLDCKVPLRRVLIVRGTQGRPWLANALTERGAQVDFLAVYERVPATWAPGAMQALSSALEQPAHCVFLLTSSEGVAAIAARLREHGLLAQWGKAAFVVIHERIGTTLQSVLASQPDDGVRRLELCMPDDDSIVQAVHAVARSTAKP